MSLDDLITLVLIVLFVGFPLLQRFLRSGSGPQQPGDTTRGKRPDRDEGSESRSTGPADAEQARGQATGRPASASTSEASDGASELERRIEEARRRVQQARQGSSTSQRPTTAASASQADASSRPLVRPREPQRESPREYPPAGFLGREGTPRKSPKKAPPMQVAKRKKKSPGSRMSKGRVVSLEPNDIFRGIVWHQILSEPVSARKRRRRSSRDR